MKHTQEIGHLKHRINLYRRHTFETQEGTPEIEWEEIGTAFAKIRPFRPPALHLNEGFGTENIKPLDPLYAIRIRHRSGTFHRVQWHHRMLILVTRPQADDSGRWLDFIAADRTENEEEMNHE